MNKIIMRFRSVFFLIFFLICTVRSQFEPQDVCVLYDSKSVLSTHSAFIKYLKNSAPRGHVVTHLGNKSVSLMKFDNILFKNLVIISSLSSKWMGGISVADVLGYADKGGNVFVVTEAYNPETARLVSELGFVDAPDSGLIDHSSTFEYTATKNNYQTVIVDPVYSKKSLAMFSEKLSPILYSGRGFAIDRTNPMTFCILNPSPNAYLYDQNSDINKFPLAVGVDIVLIGGVEMRNKARAVIAGSLSAFSDKFMLASVSNSLPHEGSNFSLSHGNLELMTGLVDWVYQKSGVLRVTNPLHVLVSSRKSLEEYVVDTLLEYSIVVEELASNGQWFPFHTDLLQLELIRLTTFERVNYNYTGQGRYSAQFYTPDFIGTYGLHTNFKKLGYTTLDHQVKIVIRPRKHDDYQRFLSGAWPYYLTTFSMMFMVFCLVIALLNQSSPKLKGQ